MRAFLFWLLSRGKRQATPIEIAKVLPTIGIAVPDVFPFASYEAVHLLIVAKRFKDQYFGEYAGAWNAIGYRFRSVVDYSLSLSSSLAAHGATPPPGERQTQEEALFGLFNCGFSTLECAFYGLFSIGAMIAPANFPFATPKDRRSVSAKSTAAAFAAAFPGDPIVIALNQVISDGAYDDLKTVRNVLAHRSAPGRLSFRGGNERPTEWKLNDLPLDSRLSTTAVENVVRLLTILLDAGAKFATARIV